MADAPADAEALLGRAVRAARERPLDEALEMFRVAEGAFRDAGRPDDAVRVWIEEARALAGASGSAHVRRAHALLDRAEEALSASPLPSPAARASLHHARGYAWLRTGQAGRALDALSRAESAYRESHDRAGEARVLDTLGVLFERTGDRERAALLLARSLALKQEAGDRHGVAIALGNLGRMALHGGRAVEAEAFFRMDLDLARSLGDRRGEAIVLANLAESLAQQGRIPEARRAADDARDVGEDLRDPVVEGFALLAAGEAARADGEHDEAGERALAAEERFRAAGMAGGIAHARLDLSRALAAGGDRRGAIRAAVGAARAARTARSGALEIEALLDVQAAVSESGEEARAARFLRRAQEAALREGLEEWMDRIRRRLAREAASWARAGTLLRVRLEAGAGFLAGRGTAPQPFQVEGFLGQGAFAVVLLVRDLATGRRLALKRLHNGQARLHALARRLQREFTALAKVAESPLVARPLGYGSDEGVPVLLIEYVEPPRDLHRSLEELLKQLEAVPPVVALRLGRDMALGLSTLHAARIVHRDVKPSNVLLNAEGRAVLVDYGLAYEIGQDSYVPHGGFKGSLAYIAPELCDLESDRWTEPTPASDMYSLGLVLYEMLTGRYPFPGDGGLLTLVRAKASGRVDAEALSAAAPEVRDLVLRLVSAPPEERPDAARAAAVLARAADDAERALSAR